MNKMAIFTIILLASSAIYSQNQHSFFPHHVGDLWEYVEYEFGGLPISTFQATITSDSVDSSGNTHVYFINYTIWSKSKRIQAWPSSEFIIDSLNNVYHLEEGGRPYFLIYKFELFQNHPNPFNLETKISFQVKERNEVNLTIFDINGKQIKNIFKGELEAGLHTYRFEATDISSGIYIYQLRSRNNILQKKCILIK